MLWSEGQRIRQQSKGFEPCLHARIIWGACFKYQLLSLIKLEWSVLYTHVCLNVRHMSVHVCMSLCVCLCVCTCIYVSVCACMYICLRVCTCVCLCVCMCIYSLCVHMCVYATCIFPCMLTCSYLASTIFRTMKASHFLLLKRTEHRGGLQGVSMPELSNGLA